jgi:hypothetical protein
LAGEGRELRMDSWQLEDALSLIRAIGRRAEQFGYSISLGGSVLMAGASIRDLDLYFITHDLPGTNLEGLVAMLTELWGPPRDIVANTPRKFVQMEMLKPNPPPGAPMFLGKPYDVAHHIVRMANDEILAERRRNPNIDPFQLVRLEQRMTDWLISQEQYVLRNRAVEKTPQEKFPSPFAKKLSFIRGTDDDAEKIDVFIVGGMKGDGARDRTHGAMDGTLSSSTVHFNPEPPLFPPERDEDEYFDGDLLEDDDE